MQTADLLAWALYLVTVVGATLLVASCFRSLALRRSICWVFIPFAACPWVLRDGSDHLVPGVFLGLFDFLVLGGSVAELMWGLRAPLILALLALLFCLTQRRRWRALEEQARPQRMAR